MRIDKLTTKFQEALSEAQSIALAKDNQYIEPAHVLLAMLRDSDGGAKSLLTRAGVNLLLANCFCLLWPMIKASSVRLLVRMD